MGVFSWIKEKVSGPEDKFMPAVISKELEELKAQSIKEIEAESLFSIDVNPEEIRKMSERARINKIKRIIGKIDKIEERIAFNNCRSGMNKFVPRNMTDEVRYPVDEFVESYSRFITDLKRCLNDESDMGEIAYDYLVNQNDLKKEIDRKEVNALSSVSHFHKEITKMVKACGVPNEYKSNESRFDWEHRDKYYKLVAFVKSAVLMKSDIIKAKMLVFMLFEILPYVADLPPAPE